MFYISSKLFLLNLYVLKLKYLNLYTHQMCQIASEYILKDPLSWIDIKIRSLFCQN